MKIRNLSLFVSDDTDVTRYLPDLVDVNETRYGWDIHCRDAFSRTQNAIDLMSADVNFSLDSTDPEYPGQKEKNSWGLVHALAGLARRSPMDEYGNRLPLAWEVRTASPDLIRTDPSAVRVYGLLRALAAEPLDPNEQLEDCIRREFEQRWGQELVDDPSIDAKSNLAKLLIQDFVSKDSETRLSAVHDILRCLLPQWRRKFAAAIKAGQVTVHVDKLLEQAKIIRSKARIDAENDGELCVPLQNRVNGSAYGGIGLFSILADLFKFPENRSPDTKAELVLDVTQKFPALAARPKAKPLTIAEWYDDLATCAGGLQRRSLPSQVLSTGLSLEEAIKKKDVQGLVDSLSGQQTEMGILFCLLVAHRQVMGLPYLPQKDMARSYDLPSWHGNMFARPIHNWPSVFPNIGGPDEIGKNIVCALQGKDHRLGEHWDGWMKPGFILWVNKIGGLRPIAQKSAPALFASAAAPE